MIAATLWLAAASDPSALPASWMFALKVASFVLSGISAVGALIAAICWWKVATIPPGATQVDRFPSGGSNGDVVYDVGDGVYLDAYGGLKLQAKWNGYGAIAAGIAALATAVLIAIQAVLEAAVG